MCFAGIIDRHVTKTTGGTMLMMTKAVMMLMAGIIMVATWFFIAEVV